MYNTNQSTTKNSNLQFASGELFLDFMEEVERVSRIIIGVNLRLTRAVIKEHIVNLFGLKQRKQNIFREAVVYLWIVNHLDLLLLVTRGQ